MPEEISPSVKAAFAGKDFDPHQVPIKEASTILVFDDRPDLHVLMMRRRARSEFVGGMMVFPGGGLDEADSELAAHARITGEHDEAHRSYLVAAVRETFEECGVLLTVADGGAIPDAAFAAREAVQRETLTFGDLLDRHGLSIDADHVYAISRWITPVGPPRRYDTMFFACAMPPGQHATGDDDEAEHLEWVRPSDGYARWEAGDYVMLPPTTAMLKMLMPYRSTAEIIAAIRASAPDLQAVVVVGDERGSYRIVLPTEADYGQVTGRTESGWVRVLR